MRVWAIRLNMNEEYQRYLPLLNKEKVTKVERFWHHSDRLRTVCGDLLVRKGITELLGLEHTAISFAVNQYGKPYLPMIPDFHFNVSHAGRWVVAAFAGLPVGIDVEQLRLPIDPAVPERVLSAAELTEYIHLREEEKGAYFFRIWTLKESFVKAVGSGLSMDPATITLTADACMVNGSVWTARFREYDLDEDYRTAVCVLGDEAIPEVVVQPGISCFDSLLADKDNA